MSRHRQKTRPAGMWALATLLLNTMVIKFAYLHHAGWYWALAFTLPLLWWALIEAARGRGEES